MSQLAVEAIDVHKHFGHTKAVSDINLAVQQGEFFSLLGPSGCGKTTLLRMIAGFETPSQGKILVDGKDMTPVPPHRRPVNMVFQSYALFPHLSVFENVAFGLRSACVNKAEIAPRVNEALGLVKLGSFGDRYPRQLSGGQQQRVALARAIVNRPSVLLLDEPLSALDLKIRQEMQAELARLKRETGITFIMVTHDQGEALALSNRIAVFYHGHLEQVGTPEDIFERPRTAFVADFIGKTNLIEARVVERRSPYIKVESNVGSMWVKDCEHSICEDVVVWVRTESLSLSGEARAGSGDPVNIVEAVVTNRSYQGASTDYTVTAGSGLSLSVSGGQDCRHFDVGDRVSVSFPADAAGILPAGKDQPAKTQVSSEPEAPLPVVPHGIASADEKS